MTVIAENNQTLIDIAIQYMGSAEHAMKIALENDIEVTATISTGDALVIPDYELSSAEERVVKYLQNKNIKPAGQLPA